METKWHTTSRIFGLAIVLLLACLNDVESQLDMGNIIFLTRAGDFQSRVHCTETFNCTAIGADSVFWTLFGLGSQPLPNTDTRYFNTTSMVVDNMTVVTAQLVVSPVSVGDPPIYICRIEGDSSTSINFNVAVDPDPFEIVTQIANRDVTGNTVGDVLAITCQVETCLPDVIVSFYKGEQVVFTSQATNPVANSVAVTYHHTVAMDSAGQYACRGFTTLGSTPFEYFNITGTPSPAPTDPTPTPTTGTSSSSSTSSGTQTANPTATPTTSPSPSPGGSMGLIAQWTTVLSLLVVALVTMVLV